VSSTALIPAGSSSLTFAEVERLGENIARSGLFGIKTKEQAVALMMIAHAEGRHPALAARDYDIIQGRPAKKSEAMLRDFLEAGGKVQWHALTDDIADATFSHPQGGTARISWNMERAVRAGLGRKDNYRAYPRQMLRSRTVSEGVRTVWPGATSGLYVPEEVATIEGVAEPSTEATTRREQINADVPLTAQPQAQQLDQQADRAYGATAGAAKPPGGLDEPRGAVWLKNLDALLAQAQARQEVVDLRGDPRVSRVLEGRETPDNIKRRIEALFGTAFARFPVNGEGRAAADPPADWNDPISELLAEVAAMDLIALNGLPTNAAWRARAREAASFPPDEARLNEAIAERRAALQP